VVGDGAAFTVQPRREDDAVGPRGDLPGEGIEGRERVRVWGARVQSVVAAQERVT